MIILIIGATMLISAIGVAIDRNSIAAIPFMFAGALLIMAGVVDLIDHSNDDRHEQCDRAGGQWVEVDTVVRLDGPMDLHYYDDAMCIVKVTPG